MLHETVWRTGRDHLPSVDSVLPDSDSHVSYEDDEIMNDDMHGVERLMLTKLYPVYV